MSRERTHRERREEEAMGRERKGKRIIDVASSPYGFDIEKINDMGLRYEIVAAIPSKFAHISAANILKKNIEKYL